MDPDSMLINLLEKWFRENENNKRKWSDNQVGRKLKSLLIKSKNFKYQARGKPEEGFKAAKEKQSQSTQSPAAPASEPEKIQIKEEKPKYILQPIRTNYVFDRTELEWLGVAPHEIDKIMANGGKSLSDKVEYLS